MVHTAPFFSFIWYNVNIMDIGGRSIYIYYHISNYAKLDLRYVIAIALNR